MRVVISSAGRRVYLVLWFHQALRQLQLSGDVYVLDHDPYAAAAVAADGYRHMPAFSSAEYPQRLAEVIDELAPDLFISLNDYELIALSQGLSEQIRSRGVVVPVLDAAAHRAVADKLEMSRVLRTAGIPTPTTVLLSDAPAVQRLIASSSALIVKDRWGSGSSGLRRFTRDEALRWVSSQRSLMHQKQASGLDELIMQPAVEGAEHGIDIVTPPQGGEVKGVLARRKLGMRNGETSCAISVDSEPFQETATAVATLLGTQGIVDVDVMLTSDGVPYVIDINPRFGGGYPFSHLAGANVPHFLVAEVLGLVPEPGWNAYTHGYVASKHEGIIGSEIERVIESQTPSHQEPALLI